MTTTNRKKSRLRAVLMIALALGASSATLSGTVAALSSQQATASIA
jgi:hypothetical protein